MFSLEFCTFVPINVGSVLCTKGSKAELPETLKNSKIISGAYESKGSGVIRINRTGNEYVLLKSFK